VNWCPGGNRLDQDIFDAMTEFITQLMQRGERLAGRLEVPVSCMKALRSLDVPVTMKDLGQRLHCDPSFVTMIADALERRGLARREPSATDRRIKNLVLTPEGIELKATLEQETQCVMPWADALTEEEREQFLGLVRKMNATLAEQDGPPPGSGKSHAVKVKDHAAAAAVAAVLEEVTSSTTSAAG
jgi:MarR family transcriptional regulator, organic hydroperoxide resistance regulator